MLFGTLLLGDKLFLAAHVGTKCNGNVDGAVSIEVVFEECDEHTGRRNNGVVEGVGKVLAVLAAYADLQAACLCIAEVGAAADLEVFLLARRPCFNVNGFNLECCSGDLADLKVKSIDVEAWSPRQKKYFEVGSCSNLGDAQARRLKIRVNGADGKKYLAHTLNNTVVAPPRMLIAFLENNLNADGSINVPVALRPYMGGKEKLIPKQ